MLFPVLVTLACLAMVGDAHRQCPENTNQFDGYTYIVDPASKERVWSHCAFFNPTNDHALCGRSSRPGNKYYLCDPDNLLETNTSESAIEERLSEVRSKTATVCFDAAGERIRVVVAVAIFDRIRIPDLYNPDLCLNDCGQLLPWSDQSGTGWYPNDDEQYQILQIFADGLRHVWKMGQCGNDVIVVYCKEFNKLQLSVGRGASDYITQHQISSIRQGFLQYLQGNNQTHEGLTEGLLYVVKNLKETLKSVAVAVIIISTVLSLIFGTFVWFLTYAARYYFEVKILRQRIFSYPWKALTWLLKVITGISVIKLLFLMQMRMSPKGTSAVLCAAVGLLLVWTLVYYTEGSTTHNLP